MKFRKKAVDVDLVRFVGFGNPLPDTVELRQRNGRTEVYNELHQSWIGLEPGDYLNVSTPGDIYPIKAAIVAETYEQL